MNFNTTNDFQLKQSLERFSEGDFAPLFKLAMENLFNPYELLQNPNFVINILKQFKGVKENHLLIDMVLDHRMDFSKPFNFKDCPHQAIIEQYWGKHIPDGSPLILAAVPFLSDEDIAKIINQSNFYKIEDKTELASTLIDKFFKQNLPKSLEALRQEYFILNDLKRYESTYIIKDNDGKDKKVNLEEFLFEEILDKPELILSYANLFYNSIGYSSDRWMMRKLEEQKIDYKILNKFIDINFEHWSEEDKENILANTLYNTKDNNLFHYMSNKMGISDIKSYKPKEYPIWSRAGYHKNKDIFKKILKNGVSLYDYQSMTNKTFIHHIIEHTCRGNAQHGAITNIEEILKSQNINQKKLYEGLLEYGTVNNEKYTNFSILANSGDATLNTLLNFKLEDLACINKQYDRKNFENLLFEKKLELISNIALKTFLSPICPQKNSYNKEIASRKSISFNSWINNEYDLGNNYAKNYILDEHLSFLSSIKPTDFNGQHDYRDIYFKIVDGMFDYYSVKNISQKSGIYHTLLTVIDYVASNQNLNWKELGERIDTKYRNDEMSEGGRNLLNYVSKICLSYNMTPQKAEEKKKFKV